MQKNKYTFRKIYTATVLLALLSYTFVSASSFEPTMDSTVGKTATAWHEPIKKTVKNNTATVFYAIEDKGVIGKSSLVEKENPSDNFFTINLPETVDLNAYDVVLNYNLYGIDNADHTTKSINNNIVYGGQSVKLDNNWKLIKEYIPTQFLKTGKNEIFFNRKADENYLYKIKNLNIELVKKRMGAVFVTQERLTNFNGTVHVLGYADSTIGQVEILGQTIAVKNGVFEYLLKDVPKRTKKITIKYGNDTKSSLIVAIDYSKKALDYIFEMSTSSSPAVVDNKLATLTLDALTIKRTSEQTTLINRMLHVQGVAFDALKPLNSDIVNVTSGGFLAYRIKSLKAIDSSTVFKLSLKYDSSKIPDGYTEKDIHTFVFDKDKREWVMLPVDELDYENKTIISALNGDTDYINGVIKMPEMPETTSFTPTTITDMKYANPSAGVVSIAPPSPNANGTASTSFPIKLPPGRNGMAPSLGVSYSSDAGNSWMGMGWNLQLPAITIDTRWGVPRYDHTYESEIYQLNGEDLVLKVDGEYTNPHRKDSILRTADRIFYMRKEGSYYKIVRKGTSPENYTWEVTDKMGNISYYGTNNQTRVFDEQTQLNRGNITHWALYKTEDTYGNYVEYFYDKGVFSNDFVTTAKYFYPKTIKYTLQGNLNRNYYQIDFSRGGERGGRKDIIFNARTGVMMVTHQVLKELKISYVTGSLVRTVRSYRFDYASSSFLKNQLSKIAEYDANNNLFYTNTMEYYDEVPGGNQLFEGNTVTWDNDLTPFTSILHDIASTVAPKASTLGTSTSSGFAAGLRVGLGFGNPSSVNNTFGGSYNYSQSNQKTKISFIDINGDGLPDKVYKHGNHVSYMPNLGIVNGEGVFGPSRPVYQIDKLDKTKSKTNTLGVDLALGIGHLRVGAGKSWSTTRTETDGYFTDFNGDGLPDIISGGRVLFNKTTVGATPTVSYNTSVMQTPNPIQSGIIDASIIPNLDLESLDQLRDEHDQFDHVKVWKAPYSGNIYISGNAKLVAKNNCDYPSEANIFKLTIERAHGNTNSVIKTRTLQNVNSSTQLNRYISHITKGDIFFFRIHNVGNGCGGEVAWNPMVRYSIVSNIPNALDEQGDNNYKIFRADADYIMNNGGTWSPDPADTSVQIDWNLTNSAYQANQFSDDIDFVVEKIRRTHNTDSNSPEYGNVIDAATTRVEWVRRYHANTGNISNTGAPFGFGAVPNQFANGVSPSNRYSYAYRFYVRSDSNVKWDEIAWKPSVSASSSGAQNVGISYVTYDTNSNQTNYQVAAYSFPTPQIDSNVPNDGQTPMLTISHNMFSVNYSQFINNSQGYTDADFPIKINWIVKEKLNGVTKVRYKRTFYMHRIGCNPFACNYRFTTGVSPYSTEISSNPTFSRFNLSKTQVQTLKNSGGIVYAAFYIDNARFGRNNDAAINIALHTSQQNNYSYNSATISKPFMAQDPTFYGWTYRGWGQFLYNGGIKMERDAQGNVVQGGTIEHYGDTNGNPVPIDMSVFDQNVNPDDVQNNIDNIDNVGVGDTEVRYTFYTQDNVDNSYNNAAIKYNDNDAVNYGYNGTQLTARIGRFAKNNIYDLYTDPNTLGQANNSYFVALKQRTISKGSAVSGNLGVSQLGNSGSVSGTRSEASSKVLSQYIDLNGDRYPDLVTAGEIQFTKMTGGLTNDTIANDFVSGGDSKDETIGVSIAGTFPNSTTSDNGNIVSATKTNVNAGLNASSGVSYNTRLWVDMNGDGLADKVRLTAATDNSYSQVLVQLNTGYDFAEEVDWAQSINQNVNISDRLHLIASKRGNIGISGTPFENASWAAGIGVARSTANLNAALIDVNGDGLPDLVVRNGNSYKYYINNGPRFIPESATLVYEDSIDRDVSVTGNIFGSGTFGFVIIPFFGIKITFTPTVSANAGVNFKQIAIQDINGDGLPDILSNHNTTNTTSVLAKLNKVGKTGLLKTINTPMGGYWTIDYQREGNTYKMPQSKWALHKIKTNDAFTADAAYGLNESEMKISYSEPRYDRRDRDFLGFEEVRTDQINPNTQSSLRHTTTAYHNDNIYLKGLTKHTAVYDANDALLNESSTLYTIMSPETPQVNLYANATQHYLQNGLNASLLDQSRLFTAPVKTTATTYEDGDGLSTEQQFVAYSPYGNLLTYKNLGDINTSGISDAYRSELEYYNSIPGLDNSTGFVKKIQVKRASDGQLMREREVQYNSHGKLHMLKTKLNDTQYNITKIYYDSTYGNITGSSLQNGFTTTISYDDEVHTYPTEVTNTFNETSTTEYDYLLGVPILVTDTNNNKMRTRYDNRGRVVEVTGPNEFENSKKPWTIRMQYEGERPTVPDFNGNNYIIPADGVFEATAPGASHTTTAKHFAVTRHHVSQAQGGTLLTVSLVDGLGKAIQLKKTLFANSNSSNQLRWLISAKEEKDVLGRVIKSYLPTTQIGYPSNPNDELPTTSYAYVASHNNIAPTIMTYDAKDRPVSVQQPGVSQVATSSFSVADGMFKAESTNELGQKVATFTDVLGRQRKIVQNDELTTQFYYNAVGEKVKVRDQQGYDTFFSYDLAGRRIEERQPDRGLQIFTYDELSNLKTRTTSNLIANGSSAIHYYYDNHNRLIFTKYPENPENNITYVYGAAGDAVAQNRNAVGRLLRQKDASGVQAFGYDSMGNLNKQVRGVAVAGRHMFWYYTQWNYDSFNRIQNITYPDGEQVIYKYNLGGTLSSVLRTIPNVVYNRPIVRNIKYTNFGERAQITYGNGTSTNYSYDNRRRLQFLGHHFSGFDITNRYGYDLLSNITSVQTQNPNSSIPGAHQLGGPVKHTYEYDNYNQLISAKGRYTGPNDFTTPLLAQKYSLEMKYDLAHNILEKTQTHIQGEVSGINGAITSPETVVKTNYHLQYGAYATGVNVSQGQYGTYGYVQPHAAREIIETPSAATIGTASPNYKKKLISYDANGNQTLVKQVVGTAQQTPAYTGVVAAEEAILRRYLWDEEDRLRAVDLNPEDPSAHPLAVYTYDAAGQRAVRYVPGRLDVRSNAHNVSKNERDEVMLYPSPLVTAKALTKPGKELRSKYTKHYYIGSERINSTLGTVDNLGLFPTRVNMLFPAINNFANGTVATANNGLEATYTALEQQIDLHAPVSTGTVNTYSHSARKFDAYWYHSDHLGNSSYISNLSGQVTQHMEYLPFGEILVDEHQNSYNSPFKFNAKELDEESGNYYYGARYYNPKFSVWLSVDPLAEKYPSYSPYNYTLNNPINLIDPDGRSVETDFVNIETGDHLYINDGVDQIVLTDNEDWDFIEQMSTADTWNIEQTYQYDEIISCGVLDLNSDLGKLTRIAFAEFEGQGVKAKMIAAESVLNRIDYNGEYVKYSPDLNVSTVDEAITAPKAYAQSPSKQQYTDPYGYLNGGGGFGAEYRDKFARGHLADAAYAAYKVQNDPSSRTGVHYYVSPPRTVNTIKGLDAYKAGDLQILNLNIRGISGAGKLIK